MKLSITSLYIISDAPKYGTIWTENSNVIDSIIPEILKYKSWILASWHRRYWIERFKVSNLPVKIMQQKVRSGSSSGHASLELVVPEIIHKCQEICPMLHPSHLNPRPQP